MLHLTSSTCRFDHAVSGGGKSVIINKFKRIVYFVEKEIQREATNLKYESILDNSVGPTTPQSTHSKCSSVICRYVNRIQQPFDFILLTNMHLQKTFTALIMQLMHRHDHSLLALLDEGAKL